MIGLYMTIPCYNPLTPLVVAPWDPFGDLLRTWFWTPLKQLNGSLWLSAIVLPSVANRVSPIQSEPSGITTNRKSSCLSDKITIDPSSTFETLKIVFYPHDFNSFTLQKGLGQKIPKPKRQAAPAATAGTGAAPSTTATAAGAAGTENQAMAGSLGHTRRFFTLKVRI